MADMLLKNAVIVTVDGDRRVLFHGAMMTRGETMTATRVRHPSENYVKMGFMKDGTIKAVDFKIYTNTGAYASSALNVAGALLHKVFGAYKIEHMFLCHPTTLTES